MIKQLELQGTVVSIDAMGCQKAIARQIIEKKGGYVFLLKGNHSALHDQVALFFQDTHHPSEFDCFESTDGDHGRIEVRRYEACDHIDWLKGKENWAGLKTITKVERERNLDGKTSIETSYYISNLGRDVHKIARAVRGHWHIEKQPSLGARCNI